MLNNDDQIDLQPIDPHILERQKSRASECMQQAGAVIELEEICADAERGDHFGLGGIGSQFGIRHLVVGNALAAVVITFFKQFGTAGLAFGIPLGLLAGAWLLVRERERNHAAKIAIRLDEFERKHNRTPLSMLDADMSWKNADRHFRSGSSFSIQQWMFGGTVLALLCALWRGNSPAVAAVVLLLVIAAVWVSKRAGVEQ